MFKPLGVWPCFLQAITAIKEISFQNPHGHWPLFLTPMDFGHHFFQGCDCNERNFRPDPPWSLATLFFQCMDSMKQISFKNPHGIWLFFQGCDFNERSAWPKCYFMGVYFSGWHLQEIFISASPLISVLFVVWCIELGHNISGGHLEENLFPGSLVYL